MPRFVMSPINNKETQIMAKALRKKAQTKSKSFDSDLTYHPQIIYMKQLACLNSLKQKIQHGDTIEIHAEGWPWVIGSLSSNEYDYTPFQLADFFNNLFSSNKDIQISIELRSCNSGTIATGPHGDICFAQKFSEALGFYGFHGIKVKGYTGYVQSENPFKQSIVGHPYLSRAKIAHCRLEEGEVTFQNGAVKHSPSKIIVPEYTYTDELAQGVSALESFFASKKEFEAKKSKTNTLHDLLEDKSNQDTAIACSDAVVSLCFDFAHKVALDCSSHTSSSCLLTEESTVAKSVSEDPQKLNFLKHP